MKINGLKHLNNNFYDHIMIRNLYLSDIRIDVKCNNKIQTIKTNNAFYNDVKKLDDKNQIKEIIRYYLRNNKIQRLEDNAILKNYNGNFIAVEGTNNIYIQLKKDTLAKEMLEEIKEKYIKDRYECLFNNNFDKIEIFLRENESSYYNYIENNEKILSVNLNSKDKVILPYEKEFLDKYIKYIFDNTNKKIDYYVKGLSVYYIRNFYNLKFGEHPGLYFKGDNFIINVNKTLFNDFYNFMYSHNKKIDETKKLQLTFNNYNG